VSAFGNSTESDSRKQQTEALAFFDQEARREFRLVKYRSGE